VPPTSIEKIAQYFIITYMMVNVSLMLWEKRKEIPAILAVYRASPYAYAISFGLAIFTMVCAGVAYYFSPAALHWGWFSLVLDSNANPVTQPIVQAQSSGSHGPWPVVFILVFFVALVIALPLVAHKEEKMFRAGYHARGKMFVQSLKFGLSHLLVGIPIVIGLVLTIPGYFLACRYRTAYLDAMNKQLTPQQSIEEGVKSSYTYHCLYNLFLLVFLVAGSIYLIFSSTTVSPLADLAS